MRLADLAAVTGCSTRQVQRDFAEVLGTSPQDYGRCVRTDAARIALRDAETVTDAIFDADSGVCHERTTVRDPHGVARPADLWTSCYTPRELRLLCALEGLEVVSVSGVEPGDYGTRPPTMEHPEWLLVARRM